nr:protein FAR1-related sequence 5-like [Tanacetum cinerariifolium]
MKTTFAECFLDTRHHLCMWHIIMKLGMKVGASLCNKTDFKRRISDIVWTDQILPEIFKREWECMKNEFELGENKWLGDMFDLRESWISAYLMNVHMAGLMCTTSRSESENHFLVEFCKSEVKLHCSCNHYEAYGLLCRGTFYVLRMNNVKEFPKNYLHKCWLKNVKPLSFDHCRITGTSDVVHSKVLELY